MKCPMCQKDDVPEKRIHGSKKMRSPVVQHWECPNGHKWHTDLSGKESACDCGDLARLLPLSEVLTKGTRIRFT